MIKPKLDKSISIKDFRDYYWLKEELIDFCRKTGIKTTDGKIEIAPQFEYNAYIRDFLNDNPKLSTKDAIDSWKIKRAKPEKKKYNKSDLDFLQNKQQNALQ